MNKIYRHLCSQSSQARNSGNEMPFRSSESVKFGEMMQLFLFWCRKKILPILHLCIHLCRTSYSAKTRSKNLSHSIHTTVIRYLFERETLLAVAVLALQSCLIYPVLLLGASALGTHLLLFWIVPHGH